MKKLIISITLLMGLVSCSNQEDEMQEIVNPCDCMKQEYKITLAYYETDVTPITEPYRTCEKSTNGEVKPYDPNYKRPGLHDPQITIRAYKVTCPND